jgi:hypothetical protein
MKIINNILNNPQTQSSSSLNNIIGSGEIKNFKFKIFFYLL